MITRSRLNKIEEEVKRRVGDHNRPLYFEDSDGSAACLDTGRQFTPKEWQKFQEEHKTEEVIQLSWGI